MIIFTLNLFVNNVTTNINSIITYYLCIHLVPCSTHGRLPYIIHFFPLRIKVTLKTTTVSTLKRNQESPIQCSAYHEFLHGKKNSGVWLCPWCLVVFYRKCVLNKQQTLMLPYVKEYHEEIHITLQATSGLGLLVYTI